MTLIIKPGSVENTSSTQVSIGGQVKIGGSLSNSGKIKVYENGLLEVKRDVINIGDLIISDPEKIKELLIQSVKTAGSFAELGKQILKNFFGINTEN